MFPIPITPSFSGDAAVQTNFSQFRTSGTAEESSSCNIISDKRFRYRKCVFNGLQYFTRFLGIFTAIVIVGTGVDIVYHRHKTGYYFIGGGFALFLLETTWVIGLFLNVCAANEQHRMYQIWHVVRWFRTWRRSILYLPFGILPIIFHHRLWCSYVAGGQLLGLALCYLLLAAAGEWGTHGLGPRKERLLYGDVDSYDSSKFEDVTDIFDETYAALGGVAPSAGASLPEPMPGSSHSLSDTLTMAHPDSIVEI